MPWTPSPRHDRPTLRLLPTARRNPPALRRARRGHETHVPGVCGRALGRGEGVITHISADKEPRTGGLDGVVAPPDWESGLCRQVDADLFFAEDGKSHGSHWTIARSICQRCPIKDACLQYAMTTEAGRSNRQRWGMYGGLTPRERYRLELARRKEAA